jgi:hypothetical protein
MNTFYEHHKNSIKFAYRCFDRILLNGLIQPFQQPERVIGFFNAYRQGQRVTRNLLGDIAQQFQNWLKNRCQKWGVPILDAPEGRRDDFVDPYFKHAKDDAVVVILKARCQTQHYLQMPVVFAKLSANMATLCANGSASLCGELRGGRELGANMSRSKSTL